MDLNRNLEELTLMELNEKLHDSKDEDEINAIIAEKWRRIPKSNVSVEVDIDETA